MFRQRRWSFFNLNNLTLFEITMDLLKVHGQMLPPIVTEGKIGIVHALGEL
jgi:hypothetical protein